MAGITYDRKRVSEISRAYDYYIDRLFDRYIDNMVMYSFAMGGFVPSIPDDLMKQFHRELLDYITSGIKDEWDAASIKNEQIAFNYIKNLTKVEMNEKGLKMFEKLRDKLQDRNTKALNAFINRKKYGKTLSNRVWNLTKAFKRDTEVAMRDIMELGITDGTSASELATELKKYLKEPNKLYRRVRKEGRLTLSKQAKAYHPGMGVYRSSYKNALRLTRTEINQAYRFADYNKIQNMDFVVGIEIIRSSNPYDCDICESLKGKYPKDFLFVGHHPQCRCIVKTITATNDEFLEVWNKRMNGVDAPMKSKNEVTKVPKAYREYAKKYQNKIKSIKKMAN